MPSHVSVEQPTHDPAVAAARVVESAVNLARAEAKLVFAQVRAQLLRIVGAVLAGMLATSAAQVALLLCSLPPVLFASWSRSALIIAVLPSLGVSAVATFLAVWALRGLRGAPGIAMASK